MIRVILISILVIIGLSANSVGNYKKVSLSEKKVYQDDYISLNEYKIKGLDKSFLILNTVGELMFLKQENMILPIDYSGNQGYQNHLFYLNKNNFYLLHPVWTEEVARYQLIHFQNKRIKIVGYYDISSSNDVNILLDNKKMKKATLKLITTEKNPIVYYQGEDWKIIYDFSKKSNFSYIFKKNRDKKEFLYSAESQQYITNENNKFISKSKVEQYFKNFEKYGTPYNQKYLSTEETKIIKKSNKSYQIYQELNEYDIYLMLVKTSDYVKSWGGKTTDLNHYHLIEADTSNGVVSSMIYLDKEARGFTKDEGASLGIIGSLKYNIKNKKLINPNNDYIGPVEDKFDKVWANIMDIYLFNKKREYLFIKKKSILYKKPNLNSKSKKFLIKDDCALIVDEKDGWYQVFYYHPRWHTNTIMWIKFDAKKHGLIR